MMDRYLRWTYGHCSRVLVPSQATKRLLAGAVLDSDRIRVWPRGVDSTAFTPARRSRALRESWHVDDRRPALLHVGRLAREKGLDLLPEIHDTLHAMGAEHRFIFAGDGPYADVLRERMPDAVFTGVLPQRVLASVIASADVLVFPSRTDTAGNIVLEAQASGLPVVVSDAGGPQENIVAGVTGLVCLQCYGEVMTATALHPTLRRVVMPN
jgi:glycosyltransferase involved in cell wall biosynthesis